MTARIFVAVLIVLTPAPVRAQQTAVGAPFSSAGHRFYENIGVGWGFNNGGGGFHGSLNLSAAQGNSSFVGSQAASVTAPGGGAGSIFSGQVRPFVTGFVPVVGGGGAIIPFAPPTRTSPLQERLERLQAGERPAPQPRRAPTAAKDDAPLVLGGGEPTSKSPTPSGRSTAARGDLSVAEIKARRAAQEASERARRRAEALWLIERGREVEARGDRSVARLFYQQAAERVEGRLKQDLLGKIRELQRK